MTEEEINVAIAKACGWADLAVHPEFGLMGTNTHGSRTAVDWYTVDLNAMHEAERIFQCDADRRDYTDRLRYMVNGNLRFDLVHATARQRAEAFLRTLGRWKE